MKKELNVILISFVIYGKYMYHYKKITISGRFQTVHKWYGKKPFGIKSRRFFVDGLKPSKIFCPEFGFWTVWAKPSRIVDGFAQTVQN
jgi:hypothetical protein